MISHATVAPKLKPGVKGAGQANGNPWKTEGLNHITNIKWPGGNTAQKKKSKAPKVSFINGHLASRTDMNANQEFNDATFHIMNRAPQFSAHGTAWAERVEHPIQEYIREQEFPAIIVTYPHVGSR